MWQGTMQPCHFSWLSDTLHQFVVLRDSNLASDYSEARTFSRIKSTRNGKLKLIELNGVSPGLVAQAPQKSNRQAIGYARLWRH